MEKYHFSSWLQIVVDINKGEEAGSIVMSFYMEIYIYIYFFNISLCGWLAAK